MCEYILININGKTLGRERERGRERKLSEKYDVIPPEKPLDKSDAPDRMCSAISPFVWNAGEQD